VTYENTTHVIFWKKKEKVEDKTQQGARKLKTGTYWGRPKNKDQSEEGTHLHGQEKSKKEETKQNTGSVNRMEAQKHAYKKLITTHKTFWN